jgi:hypothetical protein
MGPDDHRHSGGRAAYGSAWQRCHARAESLSHVPPGLRALEIAPHAPARAKSRDRACGEPHIQQVSKPSRQDHTPWTSLKCLMSRPETGRGDAGGCSSADFPPPPRKCAAPPPQGGRLGAAANLPPCGGDAARLRGRGGKSAEVRIGGQIHSPWKIFPILFNTLSFF